jgi:type IV secretory pathway VirB6-like protein
MVRIRVADRMLRREEWEQCNSNTVACQYASVYILIGQFRYSYRLVGLQSYTMMRQVGCLPDQTSSTYCYVEAAYNRNPSDLYFYSLPYGIPLPNNTNLSCSGCTKSVMALFGSQVNITDGLEKTYNAAANQASSKCGADYVHTHSAIASSSALSWVGDRPSGWMMFTLGALLMGLV